jgi:hypothetical protein
MQPQMEAVYEAELATLPPRPEQAVTV